MSFYIFLVAECRILELLWRGRQVDSEFLGRCLGFHCGAGWGACRFFVHSSTVTSSA